MSDDSSCDEIEYEDGERHQVTDLYSSRYENERLCDYDDYDSEEDSDYEDAESEEDDPYEYDSGYSGSEEDISE